MKNFNLNKILAVSIIIAFSPFCMTIIDARLGGPRVVVGCIGWALGTTDENCQNATLFDGKTTYMHSFQCTGGVIGFACCQSSEQFRENVFIPDLGQCERSSSYELVNIIGTDGRIDNRNDDDFNETQEEDDNFNEIEEDNEYDDTTQPPFSSSSTSFRSNRNDDDSTKIEEDDGFNEIEDDYDFDDNQVTQPTLSPTTASTSLFEEETEEFEEDYEYELSNSTIAEENIDNDEDEETDEDDYKY